jgi:hypothetical protein|tara:strand:- start:1019 stop:1153 length:135 start_codon:yes stop_codon:yes gene_type:complete
MQEPKALVIQVFENCANFAPHPDLRIPEEEPEANRNMNANFQLL